MAERQSAPEELTTSGVDGATSASPTSEQPAGVPHETGPEPAEPAVPRPAVSASATRPEPGDAVPPTRGHDDDTVVTGPVTDGPQRPSAWFRPWEAGSTQAIPRYSDADPLPVDPPVTQATGNGTPVAEEAVRAPWTARTARAGAAGARIPDRSFTPSMSEAPTQVLPAVAAGAAPPLSPPPDGPRPRSSSPRPGWTNRAPLVAAAVLGLLTLLYVIDLLLGMGAVPRGVTVAGVPVGGLDRAAAQERLRTDVGPRTARSIDVTVGQVRSEFDPRAAGLRVDWDATLDQAGNQPLNPFTRISSFFTEREVGVATQTDAAALAAALEQLAPVVDRAPVEGTVAFDGVTPVPVDPVAGHHLDVATAADVLRRDWVNGAVIALPLTVVPPITSHADVVKAIDTVARPAVSAPVTVLGEAGTKGSVTPEVTAAALSFRAEAGRGLVPELNELSISDALRPQLAASETPGRDATVDFSSGSPVIVPSQDGRGIDYDVTLSDLLRVLTGTGPRQLVAVYAEQPAELTTDEITKLGLTGMISEFTTGGFATDSGLNIKRAAAQINGMVVQPGETFSLNAATAPRDAAHGYVEAGIINDGHPARGIGGGVSQVATTVYNAAYFAGMTDVAHKEHSFYISRYPAGREATVFDNTIDLKFRNDNPTGVLIQTTWTPQSLTVRMFGTKRYEVTSTPGPRTNPTNPNTVTIPKGQPCTPSQGAPGFTITDTRTLQEISNGQTRDETRTVRYNPSPIIVCEK